MSKNNEVVISSKYEDSTDLQQEARTYIDVYFCQVSINIIFTYSYVLGTVLLNVINRVIFLNYNFVFHNTFMLLQQIFCVIFFLIVSNKSETFKKKAGEISFKDFNILKKYYFGFACIFILNTLSNFYGNQLVINTGMFLNLRKLSTIMTLLVDVFIGKKKFTNFTIVCVCLITIGTIITGLDDFTADYFGYLVVIINNILSVAYSKFTEIFKKKTGIPNLKLLVYNSILSLPLLLVIITVSGEYAKVYNYFNGKKQFEGNYNNLFLNLFISCIVCVGMNTSFFLSNEKNSSLFTNLLANSKSIVVTIISAFVLKQNKLTFQKTLGLSISTVGAIMNSSKAVCDNMIFGNKKTEQITVKEEEIGLNSESKKITENKNVVKK